MGGRRRERGRDGGDVELHDEGQGEGPSRMEPDVSNVPAVDGHWKRRQKRKEAKGEGKSKGEGTKDGWPDWPEFGPDKNRRDSPLWRGADVVRQIRLDKAR